MAGGMARGGRGGCALALAAVVATLFVSLAPAHGDTAPACIYQDNTPWVPHDFWMADVEELIRDRPLSQVVLSGAHDAVTARLGGPDQNTGNACAPAAQTQTLTIPDLIRYGVRWLDLRFFARSTSECDLFLGNHGGALTDVTVEDVINSIETFYEGGRANKEILILRPRFSGRDGCSSAHAETIVKKFLTDLRNIMIPVWIRDNCPLVSNPDQRDSDGDYIGDACDGDSSSWDGDSDSDGVVDELDNCPTIWNAAAFHGDFDGDSAGDFCDPDADGDGIDEIHPDPDGDGVPTLRHLDGNSTLAEVWGQPAGGAAWDVQDRTVILDRKLDHYPHPKDRDYLNWATKEKQRPRRELSAGREAYPPGAPRVPVPGRGLDDAGVLRQSGFPPGSGEWCACWATADKSTTTLAESEISLFLRNYRGSIAGNANCDIKPNGEIELAWESADKIIGCIGDDFKDNYDSSVINEHSLQVTGLDLGQRTISAGQGQALHDLLEPAWLANASAVYSNMNVLMRDFNEKVDAVEEAIRWNEGPVLTTTLKDGAGRPYTPGDWTNALTLDASCRCKAYSTGFVPSEVACVADPSDGVPGFPINGFDLAAEQYSTGTELLVGPLTYPTSPFPEVGELTGLPLTTGVCFNTFPDFVGRSCTQDSDCVPPGFSGDNTCTKFLPTSGGYALTVDCQDVAGKFAVQRLEPIRIDLEPPTIQASGTTSAGDAYQPGNWTNADSVTIAFQCADSLSGISSCPPDALVLAEGVTAITPSPARDRAGNETPVEPPTLQVKIDRIPPTAGEIDPIGEFVLEGSGGCSGSGLLVLNPADAGGSGIAGVEWDVNGDGVFRDLAKCFAEPRLSPLDDGTQTVSARVHDGAGNAVVVSRDFTVFNDHPTITSATLAPPAGGSFPLIARGATVTGNVAWTEPGALDTHTVRWSWGPTTTTSDPIETIPASSDCYPDACPENTGSSSTSHTYVQSGTFSPQVVVQDKDHATAGNGFRRHPFAALTVNTPPQPVADSYTTGHQGLTVPAPGVLANDTDPNSPPQQPTASLAQAPSNGQVQLAPDGGFTYQPAPPGFCGTDNFTYVANDGLNDSDAPGTVSIEVEDTLPPTISCPASASVECTGNGSAPFTPAPATASDLCAGVTVSNPGAGSFPVGATPLNYTATDDAGLTASCSSTLTVVDTMPPTISCPESATVECTGDRSAPFSPAPATASDLCAGVTVDNPSAGQFPVGTNTLQYTATDEAGLTGTCAATVTVVDTVGPVVSTTSADPHRDVSGAALIRRASPTIPRAPVHANTPVLLTASATEVCSDAVSAEYSLDGGDTWAPMDPISEPGTTVGVSVTVAGFDRTGLYDVCVRATDEAGVVGEPECIVLRVSGLVILLDEDSMDAGAPPNFFTPDDVNDGLADLGLRTPLSFFASHVGETIRLHTGEVGDEGWFALKHIPLSWADTGPTPDGLRNFVGLPSLPHPYDVGPGLGVGSGPEALLDEIPDVTPLRATGLKMLEGEQLCAVVFDSDVSINYDPLDGSLKGANLGTVAFEVLDVRKLEGFSSSSLPEVEIRILDAVELCEGPLELLTGAPEPDSFSEPFDVDPAVASSSSFCGLGFELVFVLPPLMWLRRRGRRALPSRR